MTMRAWVGEGGPGKARVAPAGGLDGVSGPAGRGAVEAGGCHTDSGRRRPDRDHLHQFLSTFIVDLSSLWRRLAGWGTMEGRRRVVAGASGQQQEQAGRGGAGSKQRVTGAAEGTW